MGGIPVYVVLQETISLKVEAIRAIHLEEVVPRKEIGVKREKLLPGRERGGERGEAGNVARNEAGSKEGSKQGWY
jgi:hypothetical protein